MPRSMITRLSIQALFIGLLTIQAVQAQTKDASAILQLDSTTQGLLPPRMTAAQRDAIATPAQGLVIYNTDTNYYNYWNSTTWIPLSAGGSSTLIDADATPKSKWKKVPTRMSFGLIQQEPNGYP